MELGYWLFRKARWWIWWQVCGTSVWKIELHMLLLFRCDTSRSLWHVWFIVSSWVVGVWDWLVDVLVDFIPFHKSCHEEVDLVVEGLQLAWIVPMSEGHKFFSQGGHSIVKLNTTCRQKEYTFGQLHHQNGWKVYHFFSWIDIHGIYYIVKNGNQIWIFLFLIKHTVSNKNDVEMN